MSNKTPLGWVTIHTHHYSQRWMPAQRVMDAQMDIARSAAEAHAKTRGLKLLGVRFGYGECFGWDGSRVCDTYQALFERPE